MKIPKTGQVHVRPRFLRKSLVNFGGVTMEIWMSNHNHTWPNRLFGRPYFGP